MNYLINEGINKNMSKKDKIQLAVIWGLAFVLWSAAFIWLQVYTAGPVDAMSMPPSCSQGSYEIGRDDNGYAICKLEPTGCPFGDSVPLEKCAPPSDIICNVDWSHCEPRTSAPVASEPQNAPTVAPTAKTPANVPKQTNNAPIANDEPVSYAAPDANDPVEVVEPAKSTENANDDEPNPIFAGVVKNDDTNTPEALAIGGSIALLSIAAMLAPSHWYAALGALIRKPFN